MVSLIDDSPAVGGFLRIVTVEFTNGLLELHQQLIVNPFVYEQVIGHNANLAAIEKLAPQDTTRGDV